jgi:hypothetical protein
MDGVDLVVQANADQSLASFTIVHAPSAAARTQAAARVVKSFGEPHADTRTTTHANKWGLVQVTDMCGHIVLPLPSTPATPK